MTERNARPATNDNVGWNTTPTNPSTDPGGAVRAAGWATNAIPGSDEFNYLQTMWGDDLLWLEAMAPREWYQIEDGIAASSYRDLFRVVPPLTPPSYDRLAQLFNVAGTAATGGNPNHIHTDGEQLYYACGNLTPSQSLIAAIPDTGAEVWEASPLTQHTALCTDGTNVYATSPSSPGEIGLAKIDRTSGALISQGGTEYDLDELRTNGVYCVGISPFSSSSKVVFWLVNTGATAPTETGTVTVTPLNGLAIDADQCYVGGTRNTYDVWAWTLSSRANAWQITLPTVGAPTVAAIAADGDCVFVATDSQTLTAGGRASVYCLDRVNGSVLWSYSPPGDTDVEAIAVDDRYLFVRDANDDLLQLKLRAAEPALVAVAADWNEVVCDGVSVIGTDATTTTNFMRHMLGGASKTYMRALGTDPNRRPFYTLAVPVDGRI
jgi:hypothetical protein